MPYMSTVGLPTSHSEIFFEVQVQLEYTRQHNNLTENVETCGAVNLIVSYQDPICGNHTS